MAKNANRHFTEKKNKNVASKHSTRGSTSVVIKEM